MNLKKTIKYLGKDVKPAEEPAAEAPAAEAPVSEPVAETVETVEAPAEEAPAEAPAEEPAEAPAEEAPAEQPADAPEEAPAEEPAKTETIVDVIKAKAAERNKKIVLCEGEDPRVVQAAAACVKEGIARIVLLGNAEQIKADNPDVDLDGVEIVEPASSPMLNAYAALLYELRKAKGMTEQQARAQAKDATFFGALMLKVGDVDGLVSGACHSTANTLRPGLQIIKTAPGVSAVSSFNLMVAPACGNQYCEDGMLVFADCGLNPTYTAEGLADCAIATAKSAREIAGLEPRVAMLSFSTMGSAKHDLVTNVQEATRIAKEKAPELALDGELQFDAAMVPSVAALKAPESKVAGHANVLIFPDLQSGNIGYKIAERLGGFQAIGPICQGFAKPLNDLSRGCKAEDIVCAVAITALQA